MTTPTIRAALDAAELALSQGDSHAARQHIATARAALAAEPVGEGPSAADLLPVEPPNIQTTMAMQYRSAWREGVEDGWNEARSILARWARPAAPPALEATHDLSDAAPLLWLLWGHLGGQSPIGQPIRKYLGMGQFERMSDAQIEAAKQYVDCETCQGVGTIDERLGGLATDNPAATCPDCDGVGEARRFHRPAAPAAPEAPEAGEVVELVAWLRELGSKRGGKFPVTTFCANLNRAAVLLEQPPAAAPAVVPCPAIHPIASPPWTPPTPKPDASTQLLH